MNDSSGVVCSERAAILERRLLLGAGLPRVSGASAFGSPIAVELLLVPLALAIGWLEIARFRALRAADNSTAV